MAYSCTDYGPWIDLGRANGQSSQCVAWDGAQFLYAWIGPGGATLNVLGESGALNARPCNTSQGILQYDETARDFVLTDTRRNVVVGPYRLVKAVRRGDWWCGQDTREFDKLSLVHASGYGWTAGYQPERPAFVMASGRLYTNADDFDPLARPVPVAAMGALWNGYFYEASTRYGTRLGSSNLAVVVELGLTRATKKAVLIGSGDDLIAEWAPHWSRVVGVYCAAEADGTPDALQTVVDEVRRRIKGLGLERRQVVVYAGRSYWPEVTAEVWGVECYQDQGESLAAARTRWQTAAMKASAKHKVAIVSGDYDRRSPLPKLTGDQLLSAQPHYADLARGRWGLLRFSHGRPGGTRDYDLLLPSHDALWRASDIPSIAVPPELPIPEPPMPTNPPRITITSYAPSTGAPPLAVRATWTRVADSGLITSLHWLSRRAVDTAWIDHTPQGNSPADEDHTYRFTTAGEYEIALRADGPGGSGQTGKRRLVTVSAGVPPEPPILPPTSDQPTYDAFVNAECPRVASTFTHAHSRAPSPSDMGHNSYRRLALGWTAAQVQQGIVNQSVNYDGQPWFRWVPVDYATFVNTESPEVAAAYGGAPSPNGMGHTAWRRFAEFWTHRDIVHDIKGEPLEDGGAGGAKPQPPTAVARTGLTRAAGRRFVDDGGAFLPLGGTLFWAMRGWKFERDRVKRNMEYLARYCDYQRILAQVGWVGNEIDEDWPDHVQILGEVIDYAYDVLGMRTQVTGIGGGNYNGDKVINNMIMAIRGRESKVIYNEVVNEWYGNFDGTEAQMKALGKKLKTALPNLVALSAPQEELSTTRTNPWVGDGWATMGTGHKDRTDSKADWKWRHVRQTWESRNPSYPLSHGEPGGPLSSVASFMEPIHLVMSRAVGILCGFEAYCLHNAAGVQGRVDPQRNRPANVWETPGIDRIMAVVRSLDQILPPTPSRGEATRKGLGPHPLTADLNWPDGHDHGVVRDYARVNGPTFWQCLQGIKNYVNVTANRAYRLTLIDPVTHETREMSVGAGQTVRIDRGSVDTRGYGAWIIRGTNT